MNNELDHKKLYEETLERVAFSEDSGKSWRRGEGVSISSFWTDLGCQRIKPSWMWVLNVKYKDGEGTWVELLWCGEGKDEGEEVKEGLISMGMDEAGLTLTQVYYTVIPPKEKYRADDDVVWIECQGTTSMNRLRDVNRFYELYSGLHHYTADDIWSVRFDPAVVHLDLADVRPDDVMVRFDPGLIDPNMVF